MNYISISGHNWLSFTHPHLFNPFLTAAMPSSCLPSMLYLPQPCMLSRSSSFTKYFISFLAHYSLCFKLLKFLCWLPHEQHASWTLSMHEFCIPSNDSFCYSFHRSKVFVIYIYIFFFVLLKCFPKIYKLPSGKYNLLLLTFQTAKVILLSSIYLNF